MQEDASQTRALASRIGSTLTWLVGLCSGLLFVREWVVAGTASHFTGESVVKPTTTLCLLLLSMALSPTRLPSPSQWRWVLMGPVGLLAALTLVQYLAETTVGWDPDVAQLFPIGSSSGIRMPATSSLAILFLAAAIGGLDSTKHSGVNQWLALMAGIVAWLALLGYLLGVPELYGPASLAPMSPITAALILGLALAVVMARPNTGMTALLTASGTSGAFARRMLPLAVLVPAAIGWVRLQGQLAGWYGTAVGVALMVFATSVILLVLGLVVMGHLARLEMERQRSDRQALHDAQTRFAAVLQVSPAPTFTLDIHGAVTAWNRAAEKAFGWSAAEQVGRAGPGGEETAVQEQTRAMYERVLRGETVLDWETRWQTKDGGVLDLSLSASPLRDESHALTGMMVVAQDISHRLKQVEEIRQLNAQLEQRVQQRTAQLEVANQELEAFAYSVSHDLRAPLRHVDGFAQLLVKYAGSSLDDKSRRYVDIIREAVASMSTLMEHLLRLSRMGRVELHLAPVNLDDLVRKMVEERRVEHPERAVEWQLAELPTVLADPSLMVTVLANLLDNALKYTRTRAKAVIQVSAQRCGGDVILCIKDNGVGFDPRHADKLFGVFQRLHSQAEFEGTGIGLASVRRIVTRHGGRVWAQGDVDAGAAFYIALPDGAVPVPTAGGCVSAAGDPDLARMLHT